MEAWGVHPYLIGVLRMLAGVDAARQQDFYYLPQPDEEPPEPKITSEKSNMAKHGATHGSPRTPAVSNPSPSSSKAPISAASASTSSTAESLTKRGMKRSRTSEVHGTDEAGDRGPKKLKSRPSEWWRADE
jgi:hypothetical protein